MNMTYFSRVSAEVKITFFIKASGIYYATYEHFVLNIDV